MVERWFERELKLINPLYFAAFNRRTKKWSIRKWVSDRKIHQIDPWGFRSHVVMAVKYPKMDMRTIDDLRRGLYQARRAKYLMREIDEANRENEARIDREQTDIHKSGAKDIWNHYHNMSLDIGGK